MNTFPGAAFATSPEGALESFLNELMSRIPHPGRSPNSAQARSTCFAWNSPELNPMRMSVIDLLILDISFLAGMAISPLILCLPPGTAGICLSLICGLVGALVFPSPIYRRLRLRPMLLPACPCCHRRPSGYGIAESRWPRELVVCFDCKQPTELWFDYSPQPSEISTSMWVLRTGWPYHLGGWRLISSASKISAQLDRPDSNNATPKSLGDLRT